MARFKQVFGSSKILDLQFSPDSKWLAAPREDGTTTIFDTEHLKPYATISPEFSQKGKLSWTPDSNQLLSVAEQSILFWDRQTGQLNERIQIGEPVFEAICAPTGSLVALLSSHSILIWDHVSKQTQYTLFDVSGTPRRFYAITWSPDGSKIAITDGRDAHLWDVATGNKIFDFITAQSVHNISWSSDGKYLMSDLHQGAVPVTSAGQVMGPPKDGWIYIWSVDNPRPIHHPELPAQRFITARFLPNQNKIAVYLRDPRDWHRQCYVEHWTLPDLEKSDPILMQSHQVAKGSVSRDGQYEVRFTHSGDIELYKQDTKVEQIENRPIELTDIAWSSHAKDVIAVYRKSTKNADSRQDMGLFVFDSITQTTREIDIFVDTDHGLPGILRVLSNNQVILHNGKSEIAICDINTDRVQYHAMPIYKRITLSPSGDQIATVQYNGNNSPDTVVIRHLLSNEIIKTYELIDGATWHKKQGPYSNLVWLAEDALMATRGSILFSMTETLKEVELDHHSTSQSIIKLSPDHTFIGTQNNSRLTIQLHTKASKKVFELDKTYSCIDYDWSPDSALLAITTPGNVMIYETKTHQQLTTIDLQDDISSGVLKWSPDGQALAIMNRHRGLVYIFDMTGIR